MQPDSVERPTLVLMTAEPDMVQTFAADPIGSRFNVVAMPTYKFLHIDHDAAFDYGAFANRACLADSAR